MALSRAGSSPPIPTTARIPSDGDADGTALHEVEEGLELSRQAVQLGRCDTAVVDGRKQLFGTRLTKGGWGIKTALPGSMLSP